MEGDGWYSLQAPFLYAYHTTPVHFRSALDTPYRSSEGEESEEDPLIAGSHAYEVTSRIRVHSLRPWHEAFSHRLEPLPGY